jgi:hypothetical protein
MQFSAQSNLPVIDMIRSGPSVINGQSAVT